MRYFMKQRGKGSNLGDLEKGLPPWPLILLHPRPFSARCQHEWSFSGRRETSLSLSTDYNSSRSSTIDFQWIKDASTVHDSAVLFVFCFLDEQHESTGRYTRVARKATSTLLAGRRCNNARIGLGPYRADSSAHGTPADRLGNAPNLVITTTDPRSCYEAIVTVVRGIVRS